MASALEGGVGVFVITVVEVKVCGGTPPEVGGKLLLIWPGFDACESVELFEDGGGLSAICEAVAFTFGQRLTDVEVVVFAAAVLVVI